MDDTEGRVDTDDLWTANRAFELAALNAYPLSDYNLITDDISIKYFRDDIIISRSSVDDWLYTFFYTYL